MNKLRIVNFNRILNTTKSQELIKDIHPFYDAEIIFYRKKINKFKKQFTIEINPGFHCLKKTINDQVGTIVHGIDNEIEITLWFPIKPSVYNFDQSKRVKELTGNNFEFNLNFDANVSITFKKTSAEKGDILFPVVKFIDREKKYFDELSNLSEGERKHYRRSGWFFAESVQSVWNYLINGSVYDPRLSKTNQARFKCQQCAFAWWKYLHKQYNETNKKIYALMRSEIAYSALLDMDDSGRWRHGFWSDEMETHARFHLDGIEMLLSEFDLTSNDEWSKACCKGVYYVLNNLVDPLDDGSIWFLHDTMEGRRKHKFKTDLFGKHPDNSLCLNTHIHALRVLLKMHQINFNGENYYEYYLKGMKALKRVLEYQPAKIIYSSLSRQIFKEKTRIRKKTILRRFQSKFDRKLVQPVYWLVQKKFPRMVHPNGFIERDLSLTYASDRYHITNIKELLKLYKMDPSVWLRTYIVNGVKFLKEYISGKKIENAIKGSPYFIEVLDILILYSDLIEKIPDEYISSIKNDIFKETGGYSIEN